jgi:hypothetical protein
MRFSAFRSRRFSAFRSRRFFRVPIKVRWLCSFEANYRLWSVRNPRTAALLLILGGAAVGPGCSSTSAPATGDVLLDLRHEDPRVRSQAAKAAVEGNRRDAIPLLVRNLSDPDGAVRLFNAIALRKLTGVDHGYRPYDPPDVREVAIAEWKAWAAAQGLAPLDSPRGAAPAGGDLEEPLP